MAYKKQKNVNIDALIAREDFEAADETTNTASKISTLSVNDLKEGSGLFLACESQIFKGKLRIGILIKLSALLKVLLMGNLFPQLFFGEAKPV